MMEITLPNKKRVSKFTPGTDFPHKLDANDIAGKPIVPPRCWYA